MTQLSSRLYGRGSSQDADGGTIGRIRREYFIGKKTIREISQSLKVSRKVIRTPATEFAYVQKRQVQLRLGSFVGWLN